MLGNPNNKIKTNFKNRINSNISLISPLEKERGPSLEYSWISFTKECFVWSLVEIGSVVLENKIFKVRQCIFAIS